MSRAFTLVEVLTTVGIFTVIIAAVAAFEANVFSYQGNASASFTALQDSEAILRTMAKEVRSMSPGNDGSYALQSAGTSTLTFYADTNGDGKKERIRYSLIGSSLFRASAIPTGSPLTYTGIAESTSTLMNNVKNSSSTPVFDYFTGAYAGTTTGALVQPVTPTSVRLIRMTVSLDVDPNRSPLPRTYSTEATLRNLKDNL